MKKLALVFFLIAAQSSFAESAKPNIGMQLKDSRERHCFLANSHESFFHKACMATTVWVAVPTILIFSGHMKPANLLDSHLKAFLSLNWLGGLAALYFGTAGVFHEWDMHNEKCENRHFKIN